MLIIHGIEFSPSDIVTVKEQLPDDLSSVAVYTNVCEVPGGPSNVIGSVGSGDIVKEELPPIALAKVISVSPGNIIPE